MKKTIKIILWVTGFFSIICITLILLCDQLVVNNAKGRVFSEIDSIKYNKVGLLLGTIPHNRLTKRPNYFFIYRIQAAKELYMARKIEKILISGDDNKEGFNEPECMRDSLVFHGVPAEDIILDEKGYRTIYSIINANKVYGLRSYTIISQKFHNERALYQTDHLGLDFKNVQAYNAKDPTIKKAWKTYIREYFARVKLFIDLLTDSQ